MIKRKAAAAKKVAKKEVSVKVKQELVEVDGEQKIKITFPNGIVRLFGL